MKIGAVTIGQSPRTDVAPEFQKALGIDADLLQCGTLDGLSREEIAAIAPKEGDYILVTRLRDGTEVKIAEEHIHERMKGCIRRLEEAGTDLIVLFCTGEFPDLDSRCIILKPDVLMEHVVPGILRKGRLGAVLPSADQIPILGNKWKKTGLDTVCDAVSPYSAGEEELRRTARRLRDRNVDLVVLDCIGFTEKTKRIFREETGKPVILPRTLLGRIAGEMLGGL